MDVYRTENAAYALLRLGVDLNDSHLRKQFYVDRSVVPWSYCDSYTSLECFPLNCGVPILLQMD